MNSFPAKHDGRCGTCDMTFKAGTSIIYANRKPYHSTKGACAEAMDIYDPEYEMILSEIGWGTLEKIEELAKLAKAHELSAAKIESLRVAYRKVRKSEDTNEILDIWDACEKAFGGLIAFNK